MLRSPVMILMLWSVRGFAAACPHELGTAASAFDRLEVAPVHGRVVIPLYADVHGRLETLFRSVGLLQRRTGRTFPAVVILGDLGWFPYPDDLSPELKRLEIKSPADRGFANFNTEQSTGVPIGGARRTLRQRHYVDARPPLRLNTKFYFLRGNHEDHELLKDREDSGRAILATDADETFHYLADGRVIRLTTPDGFELRVGVFGGIHRETRPGRSVDNPSMTFDEVALDRLLGEMPGAIDVLLTHQGPAATHGGHAEVDALIEVLRPQVHAHGHSGHAQAPACIGRTHSRCVPALERPRDRTLALEWDVAYNTVHLVEL